MADTAFTTTPDRFHNLPDSALADTVGELDFKCKALEAELKAAKDALKTRGVAKAEGRLFTVTVSDSVRWSLDTAAVKAAMGERWYDAHCRSAVVSTVRVAMNRRALATAA